METIFEIPTHKIREVVKYLTKLQHRAKKSNAPVVFNFAFDEEIKKRKLECTTADGDILNAIYQYRILRVNQDITIHEGWIPIAKLDVAAKEMRCYVTYEKSIETISDRLWTKSCDHCGHNKIIHTAFIMQNGDRFMKVGSGCMKEMAPANASMIAREFDIHALWSDYLNVMAAPEEGAQGLGGGRSSGNNGMSVEYVYDKTLLILAMRASIETTGNKWVTSIYSEYDRRSSERQFITNKGSRTFDFIQRFLMKDRCSMIPDQIYVDSINSDIELCLSKYPHLVEGRIEELKAFSESTKARAIDIFLIKTVHGIIQRETEKEKMRISEFQGEKGTKKSLTLEIVSVKTGMGDFGGWTLTIFKDASGNMFKKFGAVPDRFKSNGAYKFTAPIKDFETYQDIKYTVLGGPLSKFK